MKKLLTELTNYCVEFSCSADELEYYLVEWNEETKGIIKRLGVDPKDIYRSEADLEHGTFELSYLLDKLNLSGDKIWITKDEIEVF